MRLLHEPEPLTDAWRGAAFAIGNFDGVHRGHQAVIARAAIQAAETGRPLGVITFEPHPRRFFYADAPPFALTPFPVKTALLECLGLDLLVGLRFDATMAAMSAEDFIARLLVERLGVGHITAGHDFHFGRNRKGTPALLAEWGARLGFGVDIVDPVGEGAVIFSSSRIREMLLQGRPLEAARMMGHWFTIRGPVIAGDQRGRQIGFPTANIDLSPYLIPALGVYAVRVAMADGRAFDGVANIGRRPTFGDNAVLLEVFLFDVNDDLYGQELFVSLVDFIRPERKFDGLDALKSQIAADCAVARQRLSDSTMARERFTLRSLRPSP